MSVVLPDQLRELAEGRSSVELAPRGQTVGEALDALRSTYPGVYDRVMTEEGAVRPHVNVFVGTQDIRWSGGLSTPVRAGTEVIILPSVSGG